MDEAAPHARESWRDMVSRLRENDALDVDQETVLIRFFTEQEVVKTQAFAQMAVDYERRAAEDGKDAANDWIRETAETMGRQDREDTERMLSSIGIAVPNAV